MVNKKTAVKEAASQNPTVENQVTNLALPRPLYSAIQVNGDTINIAEIDRENDLQYTSQRFVKHVHESVLNFLKNEAKTRNVKYIAVDIRGEERVKRLVSDLWLDQDTVPYVTEKRDVKDVGEIARQVSSFFNEENIAYVQVKPNNEVDISELVSLKDYEKTATPEDFALLKHLTKEFKGKKLIFVNATPQGGGVALMRHAIIRLYRLLGVDARWFTMIPRSEAFIITKAKFHNVLQAVAEKDVELNDEDKQVYDEWIEENAEKFTNTFKETDVIIIDDPQPCGFIPLIKKINPKAKIIYRSHIQIVGRLASTEGTPQRKTWQFLWDKIKEADIFVSHPIKEFIPVDVPQNKIVYMPATTDPLDGLNKPLSDTQMAYYMKLFNKLLLVQEGQTPLDLHRSYIIQIARFDPSKGITDVIESYRKLREMLEKEGGVFPQLIIAGNASIDDPDGMPIYQAVMNLLKSDMYISLAHDVKVARLPHIDQLLNTLLRKSYLVLQLSIKEGFEIKVTEALMKGKPMIAYRTGGIPWQIEEGINGYLVEPGNTTEVSEFMYELFTKNDLYKKMCQAAEQLANKDYLTVPNALCWLFLALQLHKGKDIGGEYAWVKDLAFDYYDKQIQRRIFSKIPPLFHLTRFKELITRKL